MLCGSTGSRHVEGLKKTNEQRSSATQQSGEQLPGIELAVLLLLKAMYKVQTKRQNASCSDT